MEIMIGVVAVAAGLLLLVYLGHRLVDYLAPPKE